MIMRMPFIAMHHTCNISLGSFPHIVFSSHRLFLFYFFEIFPFTIFFMRRGIVGNINGYVHVEILNVARLQRICWVLLSSPIKAKIIIKVDVSYSKVQLPLIVGSLLTVH